MGQGSEPQSATMLAGCACRGVRASAARAVPIRRAVTGAEEIRPHEIPVEGIRPEAISPLFSPADTPFERCRAHARHRFAIHAHLRSIGGVS